MLCPRFETNSVLNEHADLIRSKILLMCQEEKVMSYSLSCILLVSLGVVERWGENSGLSGMPAGCARFPVWEFQRQLINTEPECWTIIILWLVEVSY